MAKKTLLDSVMTPEASTAVALIDGSNLPAIFDAPTVDVPPSSGATPFVVFLSTKSEKLWPRASAAIPGVADGDPVLFRPEPDAPLKLSPFRFHLLQAKHWHVQMNDAGEVIEARNGGSQPKGFMDYIETLLLVHTPGGLTAARCSFKRGYASAAKTAAAALEKASGKEWGKQGAEYAESLRAPKPCFRFTATVQSGKRTSKSTGRAYGVATATISPTGPAEWQKIGEYLKDAQSAAALSDVVEAYFARVTEIESIANS